MLEPYYRISEAVGVSIHILPNGDTLINACEVVVKDNQLDFGKKSSELTDIDNLKKHFPAKSHIALNIFGKGILQKQIERVEEVNQNNFTQILPNANFQDFYIQNFVSGTKSFVSVIRKSEADKWLDVVTKQGFIPQMLSLGPFPAQAILTQLNIYEGDIVFDGHMIARNEQLEWVGYRYKEAATADFPLKIESEVISENMLLAYATAFQLILADKLNPILADVAALATSYKNYIAGKKMQAQGVLLLLIFFALLLINFFVFSWLNSTNAKLADKVSLSAQSTNDLAGINDQAKDKEALLKELGWDSGINKSVLIDQLAALLPAEVAWTEIAVNPIDPSSSRMQKTLRFIDGRIRVVGTSEKIIPVNEWIARVKTKKWVKNVQLDSYTYNNELNTGQFTILIDY